MNDMNNAVRRERIRRRPKESPDVAGNAIITAQCMVTIFVLIVLFILYTFFPGKAGQMEARYYRHYNTSVIQQIKSLGSKAKRKIVNSYQSMGGTDAPGFEKKQGYLEAPANATFAPVRLSAQPATPVEGELSSPFGYRVHPITKKTGFHYGVDVAAETGTPIHAALSGTVTRAAYSDAYGNFIEMQHAGGIKSLYGHCDQLNVEEGAVIRRGEVIALVGDTGVSTGPHLHFELRLNDQNINPLWYMGSYYGYKIQ